LKPKVFISWSGAVSQQVAEALDEWLPNVVQAIEPWVSTNDIQAGSRWRADIARQLEESSLAKRVTLHVVTRRV
jgi:hypothetical protein